ncbi:long-chain fatty acid-CoA ligase, partial [Friedmanniomyces endolithicus]
MSSAHSFDALLQYFTLIAPSTSNQQYNADSMGGIMESKDLKNMVPQPKLYKRPPYTVEVPGAKKIDGETIPRRNVRTQDELKVTPDPETKTVFDILKRSSA